MKTISKRNITTNFINTNFKVLADEFKNTKDTVINTSSDATLDNTLKILKMAEDKIRNEKLNNIEINVSMMLGPISISMSKQILIEDKE
ncbi:hypothetical protein QKU48_gp0713 [Fadolivirus algeromassiliense]|uniref:Uncharacterized protein n=1 Tax=Fadolivirus FV1/VV64 TaxID=3070911 RepID=A0A7D3UUI9_9VIRU|nr:hypothetical protein QKU48_gp0713 [Fadolivirus algeromassiliense]QKF94171.1 hypothetical protein Fadolivirus_1_713 [Fadolivirus FV1/VV64]